MVRPSNLPSWRANWRSTGRLSHGLNLGWALLVDDTRLWRRWPRGKLEALTPTRATLPSIQGRYNCAVSVSRAHVMKTRINRCFTTIAPYLLMSLTYGVQAQNRNGEQVYMEVCMVCHAQGVANAPKFGDKKKWARLIREGQPVLTGDAWVGVRGMPPKGGRDDLTLTEFSNAVAYMARASGGTWKDVDAAMFRRIEAAVKKRQAQQAKAAKK